MTLRYLLDTDTCVSWLHGQEQVRRHIVAIGPTILAISIITLAELRYGASCSARSEDNHQAIDAFLTGVTVVGFDVLLVPLAMLKRTCEHKAPLLKMLICSSLQQH